MRLRFPNFPGVANPARGGSLPPVDVLRQLLSNFVQTSAHHPHTVLAHAPPSVAPRVTTPLQNPEWRANTNFDDSERGTLRVSPFTCSGCPFYCRICTGMGGKQNSTGKKGQLEYVQELSCISNQGLWSRLSLLWHPSSVVYHWVKEFGLRFDRNRQSPVASVTPQVSLRATCPDPLPPVHPQRNLAPQINYGSASHRPPIPHPLTAPSSLM